MQCPNSERNSAPSAFTGPRVSKAMGANTWVAGNNTYLAVLRTAACSAAELAEIAVCDKYDAAQVWTTVASQAIYLPADQGMSVAPSSHLPLVRRRPDGSFMLGKSALCSERQMISLWHDDLVFITVSKISYGIVDKNILCRIKNIQSYKLVFCVQYFLIFTVSCSSCHSLKTVSRTLFMLHR